MLAAESSAPRSKPLSTIQRWLTLIDQHGSENAALVALFKQVDELERLKRVMREHGLPPEALAAPEVHGGRNPATA